MHDRFLSPSPHSNTDKIPIAIFSTLTHIKHVDIQSEPLMVSFDPCTTHTIDNATSSVVFGSLALVPILQTTTTSLLKLMFLIVLALNWQLTCHVPLMCLLK